MARKQALIIGLGQFGMTLARSLTERGVEVMAVDRVRERVQAVSSLVSEAACFDASEEAALLKTAPRNRDLCVCAIGDESREAAILVTALLRQMGAQYVVSRATDDLMERILRLVGAHDVVNPERAFGERLANRLVFQGIIDELPLGRDLVITEVRAPVELIGRSLMELELPRRFGVTVVALRRMVDGRGQVMMPDPRDPVRPDDVLIVVSRPGAVSGLLEGQP